MTDARLQALQDELRGRQRQVAALQDISSQLLLEAGGDDGVEAKEKVHVIGNKLRLLLRQVAADLQALAVRQRLTAKSRRTFSAVLPLLTCIPLCPRNPAPAAVRGSASAREASRYERRLQRRGYALLAAWFLTAVLL